VVESLTGLTRRYPRQEVLRDGTGVIFHAFSDADRGDMLDFTQSLDEEVLLFLREDITSPATGDAWLMELSTGGAFTVLARVNGKLAGYSSLHTEPARWSRPARWTRHIGEIRLLIGAGGRGQGLGRILAEEIHSLAGILGLRMLTAQMTFDQQAAISIFRRLGFQREAVLTDYVMDAEGNCRDLLVATRRL